MKAEGLMFAGIAVFFAATDVVYWFVSRDPTGTTALALAVGLAFLVGFYLLVIAHRIDPRPEDRPDADISEAAGDYGFFSPGSWWPLFSALAAATVSLGVVFAWWLAIVGMMFVALAAFGFSMEYYRGIHTP